MSLATCLVRNLLYASIEAYHPDPPFYSDRARWTEPPLRIGGTRATVAFTRHPEQEIDFALAGRFAEGIVVAFRGTLPPLDLDPTSKNIVRPDIQGLPVLSDWLNNGDVALRAVALPRAAIPGLVHDGFAASLAHLWPGILAAVDRLRGTDAAPRLYFTGHSKGGALAGLAALAARQAWSGATLKAATFGAPQAGDGAFADAWRLATIDGRRYEAIGDPVPQLPRVGLEGGAPRLMRAVGAPILIAPIFHLPPVTFPARLFHLLPARDNRWLIPPPIAAHLPYPGFGYGDHVCRDGACAHDWR